MSSLARTADAGARSDMPRLSQNLLVRLSVALAFADASIVVLALPQIIDRMHTTVVRSTWVIMAYNLALIVTSLAVAYFPRRLPSTPTLVSGLIVFGLASIGCGVSDSLSALIPLRVVQGFGGALVLAASLPLFAEAARPGDSPLNGWSAAAAIGAAVGPPAGGILTQLFDWRSIFLTQAPVAAFAAVAVLAVRRRTAGVPAIEADRPPSDLDPGTANFALLLLSAGIIGALFLSVLELINGWLLTPIAAAAVVSTIPLATAAGERLVRGRSAILLGAVGAIMLVAGLLVLGVLGHKQLGWVVFALVLCGGGIGLAFPGLTRVALESGGSTFARAAKTVAARDAGLMLGLLILTPIFSHQINKVSQLTADLNHGPAKQAVQTIASAPLPGSMKGALFGQLLVVIHSSGAVDVPRVGPVFDRLSRTATPAQRVTLARVRKIVEDIIQRAVTPAFHRPYKVAAIFGILVLPLLGARLLWMRRRPASGVPPSRPTPSAST